MLGDLAVFWIYPNLFFFYLNVNLCIPPSRTRASGASAHAYTFRKMNSEGVAKMNSGEVARAEVRDWKRG